MSDTDNEKETKFYEALDGMRKAYNDLDKYFDDIVSKTDSETKIAITQWVFKHIVEHAQEGGSFRYLIYNRLGFGMEAYVPLCGDGMTISNEFDIPQMDKIKEIVRENKIAVLKPNLHLCDEPNCFKDSCCGWPGEFGYRFTCSEHNKSE